jgi:glycosyltransferase involved in cell wall biosynthesis
VPSSATADLSGLPSNFRAVSVPWAEHRYLTRLVWEQFVLPRQVRRWGADVLVCVGNFCPLRSPVPVVLLSRNPTYFTPRYLADLLERGHYAWALRHLAQIRLALWSARAARLTITPTAAMGDMIRSLAGHRPPRLRTVFHGFQLWPSLNGQPRSAPPAPPPFRFLVLSHYNYFRNFETVFRAMAKLRELCPDSPFELHLTTQLRPGLRLGGYDTTRAYRLIDQLGIRDLVRTLGAVPYDDLPGVYGSVHAVICPAYTESFSHTVVEAMALRVPVIASDIAVHREVAADAAVFFSPLDASELAARCLALMTNSSLRDRLRDAGLERASLFSWRVHFEQLLVAAAEVASTSR